MGVFDAIASLIGTISQASQNKQNRDFEERMANEQQAWNQEMMDKQNAWNYEMWQKQNEYNTPVNQLNRLRDAGLNPLNYGLDGTGNAGALQSAQPLGYERASLGQQPNPLGVGIDIALRNAQISNTQANTAKTLEETITETVKREKMKADTDKVKQEINNLLAQEGLTKEDTIRLQKANEWADRLYEATVAEKEANAALSESQKKRIDELLEGEKLLQSKTLEDFDKKWAKMAAEIKKMAAETGLTEKDIEYYTLNHLNNGIMGSGISIQNLVRGLVHEIKKEKKKYKGNIPNDQGGFVNEAGDIGMGVD